MDFMKVVDQAVREIKREVNLKVLKIPEIEQKVLDATDDEPWGPHGSALAEIAQATKKFSECQMVMNVLWTRLTETGKNWRFLYKALAVIEYLVSHGSERAVDEIVEHTFQISSLASFEYTEPSGKDVGINVRKKAETIVSLLNDKDKIQEARNKAATNREKYVGLSSSGITYKSGSASSFSSNMRSGQYGGFGNRGDSETFKDSHKDKDHYGEQKYEKSVKPKKETSRYGSTERNSRATSVESSTRTSNPEKYSSVPSLNALTDKYDEDVDDFDPRGTSSKPSGNTQVDVFGQNLVDLLDEPVSVSTDKQTSLDDNRSDVDLFADADFVSATPGLEVGKNAVPQKDIDLFASQPTPVVSTTMDFFAAPDPVPVPQPKANASRSDTSSNTFDPFASVPLNNFEGSDPFGSFSSHTDSLSTKTDKPSPSDVRQRHEDINVSSIETKPTPKKDAFNVKSGIWADSLTRGLIDLNITAPKKVNLADVGIVGGLTDVDEKDKGTFPSFYMGGGAMGNGSGLGRSGFTSASASLTDDFFSSLSRQQNQFGSFQK